MSAKLQHHVRLALIDLRAAQFRLESARGLADSPDVAQAQHDEMAAGVRSVVRTRVGLGRALEQLERGGGVRHPAWDLLRGPIGGQYRRGDRGPLQR